MGQDTNPIYLVKISEKRSFNVLECFLLDNQQRLKRSTVTSFEIFSIPTTPI